MSFARGDYCPVRIRRGRHAGKLGYYDDDLDGEERAAKAIVYLGEPFESDYILLSRKDLEKVDVKNIHLERWKRNYPWLVKLVDLP
jgi:hypothetical protein